jgi:hypothetical protein
VISGYLRLVMQMSTSGECSGYYAFEADSGAYFEPVQNKAGAPTGTHIVACFEGNVLVKWDWHPVQSVLDQLNKDIALLRVVNPNEPYDNALMLVNRAANELEYYLTLINRGVRWTNIRVTPYVIINVDNQPLGLQFQWHRYRDQMEQQWEGRYEQHIYWHGWGGHRPGILGHAHAPGLRAHTYGGQQRTIRHEQFHNFAALHSWHGNNEYGHFGCIMARGLCGICGSHMYGQYLIPEDKVVHVEKNRTYFLLPVENDPKDIRNDELQALRIGNHTVSTRKLRDELETGISNESHGTVLIERDRPTARSPILTHVVRPGQTAQVDGYVIKAAGYKGGVTRITVDQGAIAPFPEALPPIEADKEFSHENISGVWFSPSQHSQGLDLFCNDATGHVWGYWFTFHARGSLGAGPSKTTGREWFKFDGHVQDGGFVEFDIFQYRSRTPKKVGEGTLTLMEGRMKVRFHCLNYARDSLLLQRLTSPKLEQGVWEVGEREGYSVAQYYNAEDGKHLWAAYYYGHTGIGDLTWQELGGTSLRAMQRHEYDGVYKMTYPARHHDRGVVDLQAILDNAEKVA